MKKTILQFMAIIGLAVAVLFITISFEKNTTPISPEVPERPVLNIAAPNSNKAVLIEPAKNKISFYKDALFVESFPITDDNSHLTYLTPGKYAAQSIIQLKPNEKIMNFIDTSSIIYVIGEKGSNRTSLDDQGLYFPKNKKAQLPKVTAKTYLIADLDSNSFVLAKDKDKKLPIASLTKLMTALITLEDLDQHKYITVTKQMLDEGFGSNGNLRRGEQLTVNELMYPLLLSSSNDAAFALSIDYGQEKFIKLMNDRAQTLGMASTTYVEASGAEPTNVSTAVDLFKISQYLFKNNRWIFDITRLKKINDWRNNNFFSGRQDYLGGKNGYIPEIRETSVAIFAVPYGDTVRNIDIVMISSTDRENDTTALLNWVKANTDYQEKIIPIQAFSEQDAEKFLREINTIKISFVGDVAIDRDARNYVLKNANGNFSFLFKNIASLKDSDLVLGNIVEPISDTGTNKTDNLAVRMHPLSANAFSRAGFNIFSIANNSIENWDNTATDDTKSRLKSENIAVAENALSGSNISEAVILERKGIKIGFLGFNDITGSSKDKDGNFIGAIRTEKYIKAISESAKKANIVVVSLEAGDKDSSQHNQRQEELAKLAIDSGAKIVIGHYPRAIQEIENYKDGLIIYSLGDFMTAEPALPDSPHGLLADIIVSENGNIKRVDKNLVTTNKEYQVEIKK